MKKAFDFFIATFKDLDHSNTGYLNHSIGVFNILKEMGASDHVCLAGLYHSVYGTDSYQQNIPLDRNELKNIIGEYAENLVFNFCSFGNKEHEILNRTITSQIDEDLLIISYANIKEQQTRANDLALDKLIKLYEIKIYNNHTDVEEFVINDKKIYVFDSLFEKHQIDAVNSLCINSLYRGDHGSSPLSTELDFRFVSYLKKSDIESLNIIDSLTAVSNQIGEEIYIGHSYINHYWHGATSPGHTDSSFDSTLTILIFCNNFWQENWGGEIKFYNQHSKSNLTFDFKPGRVIVFDSRLEHKVLPITLEAKKPRFSLAMKASTSVGSDALIKMYGKENIFKI